MKSLSPFSLPLILLPSHSLIFSIYLSLPVSLVLCASYFVALVAVLTLATQPSPSCSKMLKISLRAFSIANGVNRIRYGGFPFAPLHPAAIRHPPSLNPLLLSFLLSLLAGPGQFPVQSALCMLSVSVSSPFIRSLLANLILYLPLFRSPSLSLLVLLHLHTA